MSNNLFISSHFKVGLIFKGLNKKIARLHRVVTVTIRSSVRNREAVWQPYRRRSTKLLDVSTFAAKFVRYFGPQGRLMTISHVYTIGGLVN